MTPSGSQRGGGVDTDAPHWADAESDPVGAAKVAKHVTSEEWTAFETHYFASCCDCGLSHRVDVRAVPGGFEARHWRMDEYTEATRSQHDFPAKVPK
jgi:hypothetical protein